MSQTSYPIDQNAALLGMIADAAFKHTESKIAKGAIPVGSGVAKVFGKDNQARLPAANQGVVLFDADFVTSNTIDMDINGVAITQQAFDSDHDTTAIALAVKIAAHAAVSTCILDPNDANNRTFIITSADDLVITVTNIVVAAGASQANGVFTAGTRDALYGIAHWTQALEGGLPNVEAIPQYGDKKLANILRRSSLYVQFETAFDPDSDTLYCRFIAGGSTELIGQFRNDTDSGKAFVISGNFMVKTTLTAAGLGIIEINRPV